MCTSFNFKNGYYGRNMDLEYDLPNSKIIITPKNYELRYKSNNNLIPMHYSLIGMGIPDNNKYPLYYEAMNDQGLYMAGLNFNGFAQFNDYKDGKENVATFEFILHILGQCKNIEEVKNLINKINLTNVGFNEKYSVAVLHWIICFQEQSLVIESTKDGLKVYENKIGVLTNNPTYDFHLMNINNYINLKPYNPETDFSERIDLVNFSQGVGTTGLPGGLSSTDRFIRCVYYKMTSECNENEIDNIAQVFHILDAVSVKKGTVLCHGNRYEITIYSCCLSKETLSYYYKTYDNSQINCISLKNINCNDNSKLIIFDLCEKQNINYQN